MKESTVTVFGGAGFLGRRVVQRLRERGFSVRIASRHPDRRRVPGMKPILMPFPFVAWHALAWMSELLPKPAITRNQIELMQIDTIASPERPGLAELGISPHTVEEILQQIMSEH